MWYKGNESGKVFTHRYQHEERQERQSPERERWSQSHVVTEPLVTRTGGRWSVAAGGEGVESRWRRDSAAARRCIGRSGERRGWARAWAAAVGISGGGNVACRLLICGWLRLSAAPVSVGRALAGARIQGASLTGRTRRASRLHASSHQASDRRLGSEGVSGVGGLVVSTGGPWGRVRSESSLWAGEARCIRNWNSCKFAINDTQASISTLVKTHIKSHIKFTNDS